MPPGGHLRPLGGGFLITVAAHKCGLHPGGLSDKWIKSRALPQRTNADCICERILRHLQDYALPQRTNADCIGNIAQKCDILFLQIAL